METNSGDNKKHNEFQPIEWRGNTASSKLVIATIGFAPDYCSEYKFGDLDKKRYPNTDNPHESFNSYFDNSPSPFWFNGNVGYPMEIIVEKLGGSYKTDKNAKYQAVHYDLFTTPVSSECDANKESELSKAIIELDDRIRVRSYRRVICYITTKHIFDIFKDYFKDVKSFRLKNDGKVHMIELSSDKEIAIHCAEFNAHGFYAIETMADCVLTDDDWQKIAEFISDMIPITEKGIKNHIKSLGVSVTDSTENFSALCEGQKFDFFIPELKTLVCVKDKEVDAHGTVSELEPIIVVPEPLNALYFTIGDHASFDKEIQNLKKKYSPFSSVHLE